MSEKIQETEDKDEIEEPSDVDSEVSAGIDSTSTEEEDHPLDNLYVNLTEGPIPDRADVLKICSAYDPNRLINELDLIELKDNPFTYIRTGVNYLLDPLKTKQLFEAFISMRFEKYKKYKLSNGRYKRDVCMTQDTCDSFRKLICLICEMCSLNTLHPDWKKPQPPTARGKKMPALPPLTFIQFKTVLFWFMKYTPGHCIEIAKSIHPDLYYEMWLVLIKYRALVVERSIQFDFGKLKYEEEEIPDDPFDHMEQIAKSTANKFMYILHLGVCLIKNKVVNIFKIGYTGENVEGLYGRISDHMVSKNYVDLTIVNAYPTINPKTLESGTHIALNKYKIHPDKWLKLQGVSKTKGENEIFAISNYKVIEELYSRCFKMVDDLNYPKRIETLSVEKKDLLEAKEKLTHALNEKDKETKISMESLNSFHEEKTKLMIQLALTKDKKKQNKLTEEINELTEAIQSLLA